MRPIDAHGHLGSWKQADLTPALLAAALDAAPALLDLETIEGLETIVVSSLTGIYTQTGMAGGPPLLGQVAANAELLAACAADARFVPAAIAQPGHAPAAELEDQLASGRFRALKFHPYWLGRAADDAAYDPFIDLAERHGLPCVFHAAPGDSSPWKIRRLARRHPAVPIVLYHVNLGEPEYGLRVVADALARGEADLYLESSWVPPEITVRAIAELGPARVLFGSDAPLDGVDHYAKYAAQAAAVADRFGGEVVEAFFRGNAARIFGLRPASGCAMLSP